MDADGSNVRRLTSIRPGELPTHSYREPAWSPDGTQIAYSVGIIPDTREVRTINIENGVEQSHQPGSTRHGQQLRPPLVTRWQPDRLARPVLRRQVFPL